MLRALVLMVMAVLLAVWIAPTWNKGERTLVLRVREPEEIRTALGRAARSLGERMLSSAVEDRKPPPVATGPRRVPQERLTEEDRARLDKLVEDRLRED